MPTFASASKVHILDDRTDQLLSEIHDLKETVLKEFAEVKRDLTDLGRSGTPVRERTASVSIHAVVPMTVPRVMPQTTHGLRLRVGSESSGHSRTRSRSRCHSNAAASDKDSSQPQLYEIPSSPAIRKHSSGTEITPIMSEFVKSDASGPKMFESKFQDLKRRLSVNKCRGHRNGTRIGSQQAEAIPTILTKIDPESLKQKVRHANLLTLHDNIHGLYSKDGIFQKIAIHRWFQHVSLAAIVANAMWMAIETDNNNLDIILEATLGYGLADVLFYCFFFTELLIRFMAFRRKRFAFRDAWFVFDMALVFLYTVDPFLLGFINMLTGGTTLRSPNNIFRLLRLARLARLARLLRFFPQLVVMIHGVITARAAVGYALGLLGLITYVFAIAIRIVTPIGSVIEQVYFPTVLETMHHLLIYGAFMDSLSPFMRKIRSESVPIMVLSWFYIALSALLIMNMLVGTFCEVAWAVATEEKEIMLVRRVHQEFTELVRRFDKNSTGSLTWEEFGELLSDAHCHVALTKIDVDVEALIDMTEDIFFYAHGCDGEVELPYDEFIELLLDLRSSQNASVKDVLSVRKRLNENMFETKAMLEHIAGKLENAH